MNKVSKTLLALPLTLAISQAVCAQDVVVSMKDNIGAMNNKVTGQCEQFKQSKGYYTLSLSDTEGLSFDEIKSKLMATNCFKTVELSVKVDTYLPQSSKPVEQTYEQRLLTELASASVGEFPDDLDVNNQQYLLTKQQQAAQDNYFNQTSLGFTGAWDLLKDNQTVVTVGVVDGSFGEPVSDFTFDTGYNFVNERGVTPGNDYYSLDEDVNGNHWYQYHGLGVASTIAATSNNGVGIAGAVNNGVNTIGLRALYQDSGDLVAVANAVKWAAGWDFSQDTRYPNLPTLTNKPSVLNLSLGGKVPEGFGCPLYMQEAIDYANSQGITVAIAAGNHTIDIKNETPANCQGAVIVSALDNNADLAEFSNFGDGVTIAAAGVDISGYDTDKYGAVFENTTVGLTSWSGTSFSTPLVTAAIALAKKASPSLTAYDVKDLLQASSRDFHDINENTYTPNTFKCDTTNCGAGILDAKNLVQMALDFEAKKSDKITHLITDENGCKDQWYVDNFGQKMGLCDMFKVKFLGQTATMKYELYRVAKGADFDTSSPTWVLTTQQGEVLRSDIDADSYDYAYKVCRAGEGDTACETHWRTMDISQATSDTKSTACKTQN